MDYQQIRYMPGKVARVILNRPRYRNAQSRLMLEEMDDAFRHATADSEVRVIVLSGEGEHFSAGHDLGTPEELADQQKRGFPTEGRGLYARFICRSRPSPWCTVTASLAAG
jgi:enoyl-CoA hydratase